MEHQPCPLCHSTHVHKIEGITTPLYFMCTNCKLIYIEDSYIVDPAEEKARYDTHNNTLDNVGYVAMFERFIANAVQPYAKPNAKALDYGSGPGPVLQHLLQQKGYDTDIYDPYYAPEPVFKNKTYDLITSTETIEHVKDASALWSFFTQHLHAKGILAVMTLFHPGPDGFAKWWYRRDQTHIRFYHPDTFLWISRHYPLQILWQDEKNSICFKRL